MKALNLYSGLGNKLIQLPQVVLVDNAVAEDLDWNIWRLSGGYARRIVRIRGKVVTIQLHQEVMRLMGSVKPGPTYTVDHLDRNPLNC